MHRLRTVLIGTCSIGPVIFTDQTAGHKHVICISNYDRNKHTYLISCKTTSKNHDKVFPGEFLINDLFSKGQSKIQPYNVLRIQQDKLNQHSWVGMLDATYMPQFELGLKLAIKKGIFTPAEVLDIADSWQPFFVI